MSNLPTALDVLAEIDCRIARSKIPHSVQAEADYPPMPPARLSQCAELKSWSKVESYESHRIKYFRFRWGKGSETWGYVHIAGGDCSNPVVQQRADEVRSLIAVDAPLPEIFDRLRSFSNARAGRKSKVAIRI